VISIVRENYAEVSWNCINSFCFF